MRRALRWTGIGFAGLCALTLLFTAFVYTASARALNRTYVAGAHSVTVPADPAAIMEGERLSRIRGCTGACHGEAGTGQQIDERFLAAGAIPDLTRLAREYDDVALERAIRHGIKPDGRSVVRFMPSEMFSGLSDDDLGAIIAYLRSLPPSDGPDTGIRFRPLGRVLLAFGRISFAAADVDPMLDHPAPDRSDPVALGRYLALTSCSECHGIDLRGNRDSGAPDLRLGAAYSPEQFSRLMRDGVALGDRELRIMRRVALGRFSHLTDDEIAALHAYTRARAAEPSPR